MELSLNKSGVYIVTQSDKVLFEIHRIMVPNDNNRTFPNGHYPKMIASWVCKPFDRDFCGLKKYSSLSKLCLTEFPCGFTNSPGPFRVIEKIYNPKEKTNEQRNFKQFGYSSRYSSGHIN